MILFWCHDVFTFSFLTHITSFAQIDWGSNPFYRTSSTRRLGQVKIVLSFSNSDSSPTTIVTWVLLGCLRARLGKRNALSFQRIDASNWYSHGPILQYFSLEYLFVEKKCRKPLGIEASLSSSVYGWWCTGGKDMIHKAVGTWWSYLTQESRWIWSKVISTLTDGSFKDIWYIQSKNCQFFVLERLACMLMLTSPEKNMIKVTEFA